MRRVLPMIFTCLSLVGYAVFQAHASEGENVAQLVPTASPVSVETLTN